MTISTNYLLKGSLWAMGAFGSSQVIRLGANVVLARLLAPELFGIMLIVNSLRQGIELLSDVGIFQSIVYHKNANDPDFYNTAWTLGAIRGVILWLATLFLTVPIARFYQSPILGLVLPVATFGPLVLLSFSSISRLLLPKRLQIAKLNIFETIISLASSALSILIAYFSPTIWALVIGVLFYSAAAMIGSYFLLPDVTQRIYLSKRLAWEILHFGKWIFVSSIVYFLSMNFDRLYLGKVVPLELLGVYGIARTFSELMSMLVLSLGHTVLFPFITAHLEVPRPDLRAQLVSIRTKFLLLATVGISVFVAVADLIIKLLYDQRYHAASWMLPALIIGSWFSILANLNESTLLGLGKPSYNALANALKFVFIVVSLPLMVKLYGLLGGVTVVMLADLCRYVPVLIGQRRERFSFGVQDFLLTLTVLFLIALWEWLRSVAGFGTSFDSLPMDLRHFFGDHQ
jgi:O-antigen/teichoic acid export membrane protein